jgi:glycosyltransferase involved in cell wall biosynthesis
VASDARRRVCIVRQQDIYEFGLRREAEALAAAGYETEVICMAHPDRPRRTVIDGVDVTSLPVKRRRSSKLTYVLDYAGFTVLAGLVLAWRHLRRPYSVVQVNTMPDSLVFAATIPRLLGARIILHLKEPAPELGRVVFGDDRVVWVLKRIEQLALHSADRAITVTEALKQRFAERGAQADRISVVLTVNPASLVNLNREAQRDPDDESFTLITHGTIEDRYGHDTILHAVALVRDEIPNLRVVFTGRGSGVPRVLELIDQLALNDIVRFEGMVSDERLNDLLMAADVGVVSQKASSYSHLVHTNKMTDFWTFGLPVIHSRLRAVADHYGEGPLEFYESDDPEDLARAIRRLHSDPQRRAELVENGRLALRENGWEVQREVYLGVYDELLAA